MSRISAHRISGAGLAGTLPMVTATAATFGGIGVQVWFASLHISVELARRVALGGSRGTEQPLRPGGARQFRKHVIAAANHDSSATSTETME